MKRVIGVGVVVIAIAIAATPWLIGWQAERLVRARVAQLDVDKSASIRLRIDAWDRGWKGATARISVIERDGTPWLTLPATIRHWPFSGGGAADWVAVPELGKSAREALGPWGEKLPQLTTRTSISWRGDVSTSIESPAYKRRVPEVAGGTLEIAAIAGTVNWQRDGTLIYDIALPVLRVERLPFGRTGAPDVAEFRDAVLQGDGSLGTVERRWNQKGSVAAASMLVTEGNVTTISAKSPTITYATRDEGEHVGVAFAFAASEFNTRQAMPDVSNATVEFTFDARHVPKEPLGRIFDAAAAAARRTDSTATRKEPGVPATAALPPADLVNDILRGSPAADLRYKMTAREGRIEIKLLLAFDGNGLDANSGIGSWISRTELELDAVAGMPLVINGARAGAKAAADMMQQPRRAGAGVALPDMPMPAVDQDAVVRQQLQAAAAQGWIRLEGDEVAATVVWRGGRLTVNGRDMDALRDLALGLTGR